VSDEEARRGEERGGERLFEGWRVENGEGSRKQSSRLTFSADSINSKSTFKTSRPSFCLAAKWKTVLPSF
jgi:hypothetical protein